MILTNGLFYSDGKFYNAQKVEIPIISIATISGTKVKLPKKIIRVLNVVNIQTITFTYQQYTLIAKMRNDMFYINKTNTYYHGLIKIIQAW
jgi:hypothetical protein